MKLRVPAFYRDFACIAGACPDSCCQGWEVDADPASMAYYHTLPESEIRRRIFSVLDQDEYGNTVFRLSDQKRCPFLNSKNLCDMHIASSSSAKSSNSARHLARGFVLSCTRA